MKLVFQLTLDGGTLDVNTLISLWETALDPPFTHCRANMKRWVLSALGHHLDTRLQLELDPSASLASSWLPYAAAPATE